VLENIRGEAAQAAGALVTALLGMKNVPFANSVEVSAEAMSRVWPALTATDDACKLMTLLLRNVRVFPDRAREFTVASDTVMTAVADLLVAEYGLAFRTAHDVVGQTLKDAENQTAVEPLKARLEKHLAAVTGEPTAISESALARALDPDACVRAAQFGGGPAPGSVRAQIAMIAAKAEALRDRSRERRRAITSSDVRRRSAAHTLVLDGGRGADRDVPSSVCN
jgi:argininosuccinate lyase